jgi:hypothetical protein
MLDKLYKGLLILISFIAGFFVCTKFNSCCKNEIDNNKICFKDSTVIKINTKVVIDTIPFVYKEPINKKKENPTYDSTLYKECDKLVLDSINISDSLIKGFVKTEVKNNQLKTLNLSYLPLFPKYIKKDSIVEITKTEYQTTYEPYSQNIFYLGGSAGNNGIGISANIKDKKDLIYGYRFDMSYSGLKSHNIEFKIPLFKSKQQTNKNK